MTILTLCNPFKKLIDSLGFPTSSAYEMYCDLFLYGSNYLWDYA